LLGIGTAFLLITVTDSRYQYVYAATTAEARALVNTGNCQQLFPENFIYLRCPRWRIRWRALRAL
jgi:hypothetical protein